MKATVEDRIDRAIAYELERANGIHPQFVDMHQAWAVMLEEFEEAYVELDAMESLMESYWEATKKDDFGSGEKITNKMTSIMQRCITEMIQLAAMTQKALAMHQNKKE